jgi:hypothetical protein
MCAAWMLATRPQRWPRGPCPTCPTCAAWTRSPRVPAPRAQHHEARVRRVGPGRSPRAPAPRTPALRAPHRCVRRVRPGRAPRGPSARHEARFRPVRIQFAWTHITSPSAHREPRADASDVSYLIAVPRRRRGEAAACRAWGARQTDTASAFSAPRSHSAWNAAAWRLAPPRGRASIYDVSSLDARHEPQRAPRAVRRRGPRRAASAQIQPCPLARGVRALSRARSRAAFAPFGVRRPCPFGECSPCPVATGCPPLISSERENGARRTLT